eukprot:TCALIF_10911-PA protein Name:"Similar to SULT1E1 Estrogen sulfotransferase (Homo sapiens)" AED:0.09 eAED:0.09 QI:179/0.5/0.6/1/1/1/5/82/273
MWFICLATILGTTWTQEMVWNIVHKLDFDTAKKVTLDDRVPYFELSSIVGEAVTDEFEDSLKKVKEITVDPRIIKTHLSFDMLPNQIMEKQAKVRRASVIYVTRNPRDTAVSYYNHWKVLEGYKGSFEDFMELFLTDVCGYYTPFVGHVLSYWNQIHHSNICFITYEDMKKDLGGVIRKVSKFLESPVSEEDVSALEKHLSFDSMKKNKAVNKADFVERCNKAFGVDSDPQGFMRKGQTGNWRLHFTPELEEKFIDWEQKWLKDSDFKFVYDL